MSTLLLIIKKEGKTTIISEHYRTIKKIMAGLLANDKIDITEFTEISGNAEIDSGIIIINFDSATILSCQNAFGLHNLNSETRQILKQRWEFIEYPEFAE